MRHQGVRSVASASILAVTLACGTAAAQTRALGPDAREFVSVDAPLVALTHVRLVDGTGTPARDDQTIVLEGERIRAVGPSGSVAVPAGAQSLDLAGHTVIPGIVGLHDHMYYGSTAGGSMRPMLFSYPRLFLASGVTTIRTTGSVDPYQELNLRRASEAGEIAAPDIVVTGPYLQGPGPGPAPMHPLSGEADARRMVRYWAEEGITWFKAYTQITRAELRAAIDEAHKHGVKVTAHLCSVGFREAIAMGIDNLEHGLLVDTEFYEGKQPDQCPTADGATLYGGLDVEGPDVQRTIHELVRHKVPVTSTLAVLELAATSRIPPDQRVLDALLPAAATVVAEWYRKGREENDSVARILLQKEMRFERDFVQAGGLLAAGSDPCCLTAIAGYADQRNYELLVEAGFMPEQAIRIMTANGARVLGFAKRIGAVLPGMQADLVVIRGDPTRRPADIRNVVTVFRRGVGYDSAKLIASIRGQVGLK